MTSLLGGSQVAAAIAGAPRLRGNCTTRSTRSASCALRRRSARGTRSERRSHTTEGLEGELLIIHGLADDNVHPENTLKMIAELEKAGKHFDMRLYPGQRHGVRGARPLGQPVRNDDSVPSLGPCSKRHRNRRRRRRPAGWADSRFEGLLAGTPADGGIWRTERQRGRSQHGCGPSRHGARIGSDQYPVWQIAHDCVLRSDARWGSKSGPCGLTRQPSLAE